MKRVLRAFAVLVVGGFALSLGLTSHANAGDYSGKQCGAFGQKQDVFNGVGPTYSEAPTSPAFKGSNNCPGLVNPGNLVFTIHTVGNSSPGDLATQKFQAPIGTGFVGASFQYYKNAEWGVTPHALFNNAYGANTEEVPLGVDFTQGDTQSWTVSDGQPRSIFRFTLKCGRTTNDCGIGMNHAFIDVARVELIMRDSLAPTAYFAGGTMLNPGSVSGVETLQLAGADFGSGVKAISLNVNNQLTKYSIYTCSDAGLSPCHGGEVASYNVNTAGANWQSGLNKLTVCVQDLANAGGTANVTCANRWVSR